MGDTPDPPGTIHPMESTLDSNPTAIVTANNLHSCWPNTTHDALAGINLTVTRGEFTYLIGPSGSGKSTLLRTLLADAPVTSGQLTVCGTRLDGLRRRHIPRLRRKLGVVFQDFQLLEQQTASQNVAFALEITGTRGRRRDDAVATALDVVGLADYGDRYPGQLSGGEQQRVAIARAIATKPALLIADEPTGNLDPDTSAGIIDVLGRVNQLGTTVLMATHDHTIVDDTRRRVIALNEGVIVRDELAGRYRHADA